MSYSEIFNIQSTLYGESFRQYGKSPKATFQNNTETQYERFHRIMKPLIEMKNSDFSICDIGSGLGDLHQFLLERNLKHEYVGIEIVDAMISLARELYPKVEFINSNILTENTSRDYDFVVASGTFNLSCGISNKDWENYVYNMIQRMFGLCRVGISFNLLTNKVNFKAEELSYFDPSDVMEFLQAHLSRFIRLDLSSPLYEVTYSVFKEECVKNIYTTEPFERYFSAEA